MDDINNDDAMNLPAPAALADACLDRAWADDCDDESRELLEQAGLMLDLLMARCVRLAAAGEHAEARRAQR
jgi:hypothetical protein